MRRFGGLFRWAGEMPLLAKADNPPHPHLHREPRAAQNRRAARSDVGEVISSLPLEPLTTELRQLAIDLDLSRADVDRAVGIIESNGIGLVRTFTGGAQHIAVSRESWGKAQHLAEKYWARTHPRQE
jgi:hypothetical protein